MTTTKYPEDQDYIVTAYGHKIPKTITLPMGEVVDNKKIYDLPDMEFVGVSFDIDCMPFMDRVMYNTTINELKVRGLLL